MDEFRKDINLNLRGKILDRALRLEFSINKLLLLYLNIHHKESTKSFGSKAGITFISKIDLLYDIDILSKEERLDLELQMIFRNKFVHDMTCNSFIVAIEQSEKDIIKRLNKFLPNDARNDVNLENDYLIAYDTLFQKNMDTILSKVAAKETSVLKKGKQLEMPFKFSQRVLKMVTVYCQDVESQYENEKKDVMSEFDIKILGLTKKLLTDVTDDDAVGPLIETLNMLGDEEYLKTFLL